MPPKNAIRIQVDDEDNKKKKTPSKRTVKKKPVKKKATRKPLTRKITATKKKSVKEAKLIVDKKSEVVRAIKKAEDEASNALDLSIKNIESDGRSVKADSDKPTDSDLSVTKINIIDEDKQKTKEEEAVLDKISQTPKVGVEEETLSPVKRVINSSVSEQDMGNNPAVADPEIQDVLKQKISTRRSIKLYRNIAYFFIVLVIALLVAVFYYLFVKVTITVVPNQENIRNSMLMDIYDSENATSENQKGIPGLVRKVSIENEENFEPTGTEVIGKEAVGEITIYNNYTKNQPLVATTRLLTADNKLFRLSKTVNVPAGGAVEASIYADNPTEDMSVGPTKFTIPGLWAGLQDKIYAESKDKIEYKQKVKRYVVSDDIENGIRSLKQKLLLKAKKDVNEKYSKYSQIIYKIDENSITSNVGAEVGDETNLFTISMTADVVVVAFNNDDSTALARKKFISSLDNNKELIKFNSDDIVYALNNYDSEQSIATINANFNGKVSIKDGAGVVDKQKVLGLKEAELRAYLATLPEIASYEIKFTPSFWHHVPKLADRVDVKIKR